MNHPRKIDTSPMSNEKICSTIGRASSKVLTKWALKGMRDTVARKAKLMAMERELTNRADAAA